MRGQGACGGDWAAIAVARRAIARGGSGWTKGCLFHCIWAARLSSTTRGEIHKTRGVGNLAQMTWRDAIAYILESSEQALHYKTIAEEIESKKLRTSLGATPANTVFALISSSIKSDGEKSPFIKTNPGIFMLRASVSEKNEKLKKEPILTEDTEEKKIVRCVGMYWHYDRVVWKSKPRLLGQQQSGAKEIGFSNQVGIYLLHDRSRVIYVGRSTDRPLGQRLFEHTRDRLNGRWDRFSWFGLKGVDNYGKLTEPTFEPTQTEIISLMEAILIEALEPPQNRKRGDDFSDIEYLQASDDEKTNQRQRALIEMLTKEIGG